MYWLLGWWPHWTCYGYCWITKIQVNVGLGQETLWNGMPQAWRVLWIRATVQWMGLSLALQQLRVERGEPQTGVWCCRGRTLGATAGWRGVLPYPVGRSSWSVEGAAVTRGTPGLSLGGMASSSTNYARNHEVPAPSPNVCLREAESNNT